MAPALSWEVLVDRVLGAAAPDLELNAVIAELRAENLRLGGDGRAFDGILASHAAMLAASFPLKAIGGSR